MKPTLQVVDKNIPNIFAVGDIAETGANKAARPAMEQARLASRNILQLIQGRPAELENYTFSAPAIHLTLGIVSISICMNSVKVIIHCLVGIRKKMLFFLIRNMRMKDRG